MFVSGETLFNVDLPIKLFAGDNKKRKEVVLLEISGNDNNLKCFFEGVGDRDEADSLKNLQLWIEKDRLPKLEDNEYYFRDLVGLSVEDEYKEVLGVVKEVFNYPTTDALDIKLLDGKVVTIPFKDGVVNSVSIEDKKIVVDRKTIDELTF